MDDNYGKLIADRLTVVIRLLALEKVEGKNLSEQVRYLKLANMPDKEIAAFLSKPINTITAYTSRLRKKLK